MNPQAATRPYTIDPNTAPALLIQLLSVSSKLRCARFIACSLSCVLRRNDEMKEKFTCFIPLMTIPPFFFVQLIHCLFVLSQRFFLFFLFFLAKENCFHMSLQFEIYVTVQRNDSLSFRCYSNKMMTALFDRCLSSTYIYIYFFYCVKWPNFFSHDEKGSTSLPGCIVEKFMGFQS